MPRRRNRHKKAGNSSQNQNQEEIHEDTECCYHIRHSDIMGRFLVASQDLTEGTVIIDEDPLAVGPVPDCHPLCLGCYCELPDFESAERCGGCKWPICSNKCQGLSTTYGHSKEECLLLKSCAMENNNLGKHQLYSAIFPLRCLMLKENNPEKWKIVMSMEPHNEIRRTQPLIWNYNQKYVVDRIRKDWNITSFSEEEIHTVCGVIEVNAFAIGGESVSIQGLYPKAFFLAHNCVANTAHVDDERYHLTIFTSMPISKDETITLSYTNTLQGTSKRREHLKQCKFFECCCLRCEDPTELGTYMSALKCKECNNGRVLPVDPLSRDTKWICDKKQCRWSVDGKNVSSIHHRIEREIKSLDFGSIESLETGIHKFSTVLHQTHYHIFALKYALSQLYGKSGGFLLNEMSETMLERKIQICEDILKIFDVVEPGLTRVRGVTMYELHAPLMILAIQKYQMKKISKSDMGRKLKRIAFYLRESSRLLQFEPKTSREGLMRIAAENALKQLKSWESIVGKI